MIRAISVPWTRADFAMWRFRFALFEDIRCRRDAWERNTFPVPVTLNRFETALRVLLRAMDFGIRAGN